MNWEPWTGCYKASDGCTVENQALADYRLPLFLSYPIKRRSIACAPLLEATIQKFVEKH